MFGRPGSSTAATVYEEWVTALRAWAREPRTSLSELPALTEETFGQDTYNRLMTHVNDAIATFMHAWHDEFQTRLARASTTHEISVVLVDSRRQLGRRGDLAAHPGLPAQIREALQKGYASDVADIQQQLETAVKRDDGRGRVNRAATDAMLKALKQTPFTALLQPHPDLSAPDAPLPSPPRNVPRQPPPARRRRPIQTTMRPAGGNESTTNDQR